MKQKLLLIIFAAAIFPFPAVSQSFKISGTVTSSEDNSPLHGVSIVVDGTMRGTLTDAAGRYEIEAAKGQSLVFYYLSHNQKKVTVGDSSVIDVVLESETTVMDELVVIGYGTVRKSDLTGSVASIKSEALQNTPAATLDQALQGKAAGVTVNANTGQPGAGAEVRIRGIGSVNGKVDPLYVVDGVIVSDISFLSPNDISSTEILKDASSAAIYGSRAANGVILITTKTGKTAERVNISFDTYVGIQNRWNKLDLMKSHEYARTMIALGGDTAEMGVFENNGFNSWLREYRLGISTFYPEVKRSAYPDGFDYSAQETDWQDEVFRSNAVVQNYHLSVNGGSEKATYAISANYFSQDGTIIGSNYERLSIRLNTSLQARKWLKVGENLSFSTSSSRWAMNNSSSPGASILSGALAMAPWDPTHYPEGSYNRDGEDLSGRIAASSNFKNVTNPFSMVQHSHPINGSDRWVGVVFAEFTPVKGLVFRSDVSLDLTNSRNREFKDEYRYSSYDKNEHNFLSTSTSRHMTLTFDNILTYSNRLGKHDFSVMAGHTVSEYNYYTLSGSGSDILNPIDTNWYLKSVTDNKTGGDGVARSRMMSLLGRIHYSYDNRYLLTVNFRADGTDKFPRNMWGYFPSVAGAWKISEESWLKDARNVSQLKLRLGWGRLGNDDVGSNRFIQTIATDGPSFVGYPFGPNSETDKQQIVPGATVLTLVDLNGRWETTEHWNLGVDFGFWNNKLSGSVDLFIRDTKDALLTVQAPGHVGNRYSPMANVGMIRNSGVEFTLEHMNTVRLGNSPFFYSVSGNMSFIKNELTSLNGGEKVWGNYTLSDKGLPLRTFWGYEYMGIYRSQEEIDDHLPNQPAASQYKIGDAKYHDVNGDGKLTDQDDMTDIGNPFPKFTYGINLTAEWKGIDLQIFFQGVFGNKIYNALKLRTESMGLESKLSTTMRDVWTADNPGGSIPNPKNSVNSYTSSRFVEDGSYLRLKTLQVGYTLPAKWTNAAKMGRCRFYVTANNLLTFTKYTGYDPEVGGGIDWGNYPQSRTVMFGASINF